MDQFNREFSAWMDATGCVANFVWRYDPVTGQKFLAVTEIDMMMYRAGAPDAKDIRAALDKAGDIKG